MRKRGRMFFNRSQVSVFIVLAVIIVLIFGYLAVRSNSFKTGINKKFVNPDILPIYSMVKNCVDDKSIEGIYFISKRGGYYLDNDKMNNLGIPYYVKNSKNIIISREEMEKELSLYISDNLGECLDFNNFNDFHIDAKNPEIISNIKDEKVLVNVKYPLIIIKGENTYELEDFESEINSRLGIVYKTADSIVLNEIEDLEYVCISCIHELDLENDLYTYTLNYNEDTIIFTILDKNSGIEEELIYNFAIEYEK